MRPEMNFDSNAFQLGRRQQVFRHAFQVLQAKAGSISTRRFIMRR